MGGGRGSLDEEHAWQLRGETFLIRKLLERIAFQTYSGPYEFNSYLELVVYGTHVRQSADDDAGQWAEDAEVPAEDEAGSAQEDEEGAEDAGEDDGEGVLVHGT